MYGKAVDSNDINQLRNEIDDRIDEIEERIRAMLDERPYFLIGIREGQRRHLGLFNSKRELEDCLSNSSYKKFNYNTAHHMISVDNRTYYYNFKKTSSLSNYSQLIIERQYIPETILYKPKAL